MTKRIFSIVLAMLMVVSLFSVASFAIEGPVVTEYGGTGTVEPGDDTYTYEENGIHVHKPNLVFSGTCNERIIVDTRNVTLKDITINNTILTEGDSAVTIYMENANITGDVVGTGEGLFLHFYVDGENNTIEGDVISDGTAGIDGGSGSVLKMEKGISTQDGLMLDGLVIENMNGEYIPGETTGAFPYDGTQPITFTVKKQASFPDPVEGDYFVNNGEPFKCGEDIEINLPTVYDENAVALDPQPELDVEYAEIKVVGGERVYVTLEEEPDVAGNYCVGFHISDDDSTYAGNSPMYEFSIEHNRRHVHKHDEKAATKSEAGHKAYYSCEYCEKYFEDAQCTIEIEDLTAWLSEGGRGYIAKLKNNTDRDTDRNPREKDKTRRTIETNKDDIDEDHIYSAGDADKNETNPDTGAPVVTGKLIAAGVLCACALVLAKKKHK